MRKNVAGQNVAGQVNSRTDGSPLTASVSVFVTIDGGAQTAGGGTLAHKGNGHWNYAPTQAETNGNHLAVTFTHATGVNQTVNVYTVSFDPHDTAGLGLSRLDAAITTRMATFTLPANFSALSITAGGLVDITQAAADKVWLTAARTLTSFGTLVADIWDRLTSALTTVGSVGKLLVDNIDAAISSRLATAGYTAPPSAVAIRTEIDTNSTKLDVAVSTRMATFAYTAPDNAGITSIKGKTDSLNFTVAGKLDVNVLVVNGVTVTGAGTAGSPWGPA